MPVADGQPVDAEVTNPAFVDAQIDSAAFGKIGLLNADLPGSGPVVANAQLNINNLIQNSKISIGTVDNSAVSWSGTQLSFTADLVIRFHDAGVITRVAASMSPIMLADGFSICIAVNRAANASVMPTYSALVPSDKDTLRFATRLGSFIIFWDGTLVSAGATVRIGQGGSSSVGPRFSELPGGAVDGVNVYYTLNAYPINAYYVDFFVDGLLLPDAYFILSGNVINTITPPAIDSYLWAKYWGFP